MKVIGFDPEITVDAAWRLPSGVRRAHSIEELLKQSDFVTLHVPLLPVTRNLIDAHAARGHEAGRGAAQLRARRHRRRRRRARTRSRAQRLKPTSPTSRAPRLLREPGVVALPHLGASTAEAEENCAVMVVDQVREYLEHGTHRQRGQLPQRRDAARIAVPRRDRQRQRARTCSGQISTTMAHAGLNIHNMVNKSRGEMAYTLVDVDSPVDDSADRGDRGHRRRAVGARDPGRSPGFRDSYANLRRAPDCALRIARYVGGMESRVLIGCLARAVSLKPPPAASTSASTAARRRINRRPARAGRTRCRFEARPCRAERSPRCRAWRVPVLRRAAGKRGPWTHTDTRDRHFRRRSAEHAGLGTSRAHLPCTCCRRWEEVWRYGNSYSGERELRFVNARLADIVGHAGGAGLARYAPGRVRAAAAACSVHVGHARRRSGCSPRRAARLQGKPVASTRRLSLTTRRSA